MSLLRPLQFRLDAAAVPNWWSPPPLELEESPPERAGRGATAEVIPETPR